MNIIKKTIEYCSIIETIDWKDRGNNGYKILDPSSGGIGTRLNIARTKFTNTIIETIEVNPSGIVVPIVNRKIKPKKIAMARLASIPAAATAMLPHFLSDKLFGL